MHVPDGFIDAPVSAVAGVTSGLTARITTQISGDTNSAITVHTKMSRPRLDA